VAVKCIRAGVEININRFTREIKVWGRLQHEHILPLLGVVYGFGPLPGLVSLWMGTLYEYLDGRRHEENILTRFERFRLVSFNGGSMCKTEFTCLAA